MVPEVVEGIFPGWVVACFLIGEWWESQAHGYKEVSLNQAAFCRSVPISGAIPVPWCLLEVHRQFWHIGTQGLPGLLAVVESLFLVSPRCPSVNELVGLSHPWEQSVCAIPGFMLSMCPLVHGWGLPCIIYGASVWSGIAVSLLGLPSFALCGFGIQQAWFAFCCGWRDIKCLTPVLFLHSCDSKPVYVPLATFQCSLMVCSCVVYRFILVLSGEDQEEMCPHYLV